MNTRVLIFKEEEFPFVDTNPIETQWILDALPAVQDVRSVGATDLQERLRADSVNLLINPYGSAFPENAWSDIHDYLAAGGNLLNIGGAPFSVPVRWESDAWHQHVSQTRYHRQLGIEQLQQIQTDGISRYDTSESAPLLSGLIDGFLCDEVFELQMNLANTSNHTGECGSSIEREPILRPLLFAHDSDGRRIAAPILTVDHVRDEFTGGRWVLMNYRSECLLRKEAFRRLAVYALLGASDVHIRPSFACYQPDERANLIFHATRFRDCGESVTLTVTTHKENSVRTEEIAITDFAPPYYLTVPIAQPLTPGLYTVEARLSQDDPQLTDKFADYVSTGFRCYDKALVTVTQPLSAGKDYLTRDGKPVPLLGTNYAVSRAHGNFLVEPNPAEWQRDFADMRKNGINVVRTETSIGFRLTTPGPAIPSEDVLRAFEAFMLTAAEHDMPVVFTLFGSASGTFERVDAYLDPRCIQAQKEYIAAFAHRFAKFNNLTWDLTTEPHASRPAPSKLEQKAWQEWRSQRHPSDDSPDEGSTPTTHDAQSLTDPEDLDNPRPFDNARVCTLDYALFIQDVLSRWVSQMTAVIRQNGNPKQLITVGEHHTGSGDQMSPDSHLIDVHFTSKYTRCLTEDLLWEGLVGKTSGKANLIVESCSMSVNDSDPPLPRSEEDSRNTLERRMVTALASSGAGAILSIWNSKGCIFGNNEMSIGFHRADLTCTPNMDIIGPLSDFLKKARNYMVDRQPEDVCMVIPGPSVFFESGTATAVTRACVRVMSRYLGIPMRTAGEYALDDLGTPSLIILPSPRVLSQPAWETMLRSVEAGSALLVTGPINFDEYQRPVDRLGSFGIEAKTQPVVSDEEAIILGTEYHVSFGGEKTSHVRKAVLLGRGGSIRTEQIGSGKLIYCTLPVELADNDEPMIALYRFALKQAILQPPFTTELLEPGVFVRPVFFRDAILYSFVSETSPDKELTFTDNATCTAFTASIPAQGAAMLLVSRQDGTVLARYARPPSQT